MLKQGALILDQCRRCGRVLTASEHAGDAQRHLPQSRVTRGDAAKADGVAQVLRIGRIEHFQIQLGTAQITLRTTALQRQFGAHLFPAVAGLADEEVIGHKDVFQEHFIEVVLADHVVDRANRDAGSLQVDQQLRQPRVTVAFILRPGAQQGDHVLAAVGAGGPDLAAVDYPAAIDLGRTGTHRGEVRADIRLTHADADHQLTASNGRQKARGQHLRRKLHQQRPGLAFGDPVRIHRRAGRQQLFQHHITLQGAAFVSSVTLGPRHAQPTALTQLAAELEIGAVPVFGAFVGWEVFQRFGEKLTHFGAQGLHLHAKMTGPNIECLHGLMLV
ncbi:hypothetical protein D3C85_1057700 [compost metagenome]